MKIHVLSHIFLHLYLLLACKLAETGSIPESESTIY